MYSFAHVASLDDDIQSVWEQYHQRLRRFLFSRIANEDDAEDVLQEILIKVHTSLPDLQKKDRAKAWLFQIANRAIIDFYRSGRARELPEDETLWHSDEDRDIRKELEQCIAPFVRNLPESMADLLTAVDLDGESQKDVAQRMEISYSTLKSRVAKARVMLRREFDKCCHFSVDASGNLIDYDPKAEACRDC